MAVDRDLITVLGCGFFLPVQMAIVKRTIKCWAGYVNVATFTPAISHYRVQLNSLTLLWTCSGRALDVL